MAVGIGITGADGLRDSGLRDDSKITASMVITCIVAASGGLIFGYDIGITGGVTTMRPFLEKFFPSVISKAAAAKANVYCVYDSQLLTAFTSSLFIAGLAAALVAGRVTAALGRRNIMLLGGLTFLAGAAVNGAAEKVVMLILGRILLGFGVGFTNQATPVYLSEVAPPKWRGAFNTGFQFFIAIGVISANCLNYATARLEWGWRLSLGMASVPAAIMTIGALFLMPDTPSILIQRGKLAQAKKSLAKIHGNNTDDNLIESELADLVKANEIAKAENQQPFKAIFERKYRPHFVMSIAIPFFQQFTGINIIPFFAPVLTQFVGLGNDSALIGAIILGLVNIGSILVSAAIVDRYGRRVLFIEGGIQMFISQVAVAVVIAIAAGDDGTRNISKGHAELVLVLMCIYAAGFGWSWGPLSWLVPSEIFPLEIRTSGQSIAIAVNFAMGFITSQTLLTMICHFKYGAFLFYAGWIALMTIFVLAFVPETKGIPLNSMHQVWEKHWFWRRFVIA